MATRNEYLAQGYTNEQIDAALAARSASSTQTAPSEGSLSFSAPTETVAGMNAGESPATEQWNKENPTVGSQTSAGDAMFNERQAAFDAANPAGTKEADIVRPEPVKPVETKPAETAQVQQSQAYFDTYKGREAEVMANLNNAYSSGATTPEAIRAFASYDTATPEKKAAVDAFIASKAKAGATAQASSAFSSSDAILTALTQGMDVPSSVLSSNIGKEAEKRFSFLSQMSGLTSDQMANALLNGTVLAGSQTYKDLLSNPVTAAKVKEAEALNRSTGRVMDAAKVGETLTNKVVGGSAIEKAMADGVLTSEEIASLTTTPEMLKKQAELSSLAKERDRWKNEWDNLETRVTKETEGKGLTRSQLNQLISNRRRDIAPEYELANANFNSAYGLYTDMKKDALETFKMSYETYASKADYERKKADLLEERAYQMEVAKKKMEWENPDIGSSDPFVARLAALKTIEKENEWALENGVRVMRSPGQIMDDVGAYMKKNGVGFAEAFQKVFAEPRHNSPEYVNALRSIAKLKSGAMTEYQREMLKKDKTAWGVVGYDADNKAIYGFIDTAGKSITPFSVSGETAGVKPTGNVITFKAGNKNVTLDETAAQSFQDAFAKMEANGLSPLVGSKQYRTKEEQQALVDKGLSWTLDSRHMSGMAVDLYDGSPDKKPSAEQIRIMNENGWFQPADTLAKGDYGHFEYKGKTGAGAGYEDALAPTYRKYLAGKLTGADLKGTGKNQVDVAREAKAWNMSQKAKDVASYDVAIETLGELKGIDFTTQMTLPTGIGDKSLKYKQLIANAALQKLVNLKNDGATFGALSNQELEFITRASEASLLSPLQSNDTFKKNVNTYETILKKVKLEGLGIEPEKVNRIVGNNFDYDFLIGALRDGYSLEEALKPIK